MAGITRQNIEDALRLVRKARLGIAIVDAVSADLTEKANEIVDRIEREIAGITPSDSEDASEAGGTETSTPTREEKITYVRDTLNKVLGYSGVWAQETFTRTITDDELDKNYRDMVNMNKRAGRTV